MYILGVFLINIVFIRMEEHYCSGPLITRRGFKKKKKGLSQLVSLITRIFKGVTSPRGFHKNLLQTFINNPSNQYIYIAAVFDI